MPGVRSVPRGGLLPLGCSGEDIEPGRDSRLLELEPDGELDNGVKAESFSKLEEIAELGAER